MEQLADQLRKRFPQSREAAALERGRSMSEADRRRAGGRSRGRAAARRRAKPPACTWRRWRPSLKVPVRKLEALEDDRYDLLPDACSSRALASSVCRTLKIDPQPVLDRAAADRRSRRLAQDATASTRRSARPATAPRARLAGAS